MPVTGGFVSAAAILMASSQLKGLFGISYKAKNCLEMWIKFVENIEHFRIADTAMGLICIFVLVGLKVSVYDMNSVNQNQCIHCALFIELKIHKSQ